MILEEGYVHCDPHPGNIKVCNVHTECFSTKFAHCAKTQLCYIMYFFVAIHLEMILPSWPIVQKPYNFLAFYCTQHNDA